MLRGGIREVTCLARGMDGLSGRKIGHLALAGDDGVDYGEKLDSGLNRPCGVCHVPSMKDGHSLRLRKSSICISLLSGWKRDIAGCEGQE